MAGHCLRTVILTWSAWRIANAINGINRVANHSWCYYNSSSGTRETGSRAIAWGTMTGAVLARSWSITPILPCLTIDIAKTIDIINWVTCGRSQDLDTASCPTPSTGSTWAADALSGIWVIILSWSASLIAHSVIIINRVAYISSSDL